MSIAFDPGAERTGVAMRFVNLKNTETLSFRPWEAVTWFEQVITCWRNPIDHVVIERWRPYPGAMAGNAFRELTEVLTSGALEYLCRINSVPYTYQPTSLLDPTYAQATARGYKWQYRNRDERAAETHLVYHLNQTGETPW